jgi:hypothetical protein
MMVGERLGTALACAFLPWHEYQISKTVTARLRPHYHDSRPIDRQLAVSN